MGEVVKIEPVLGDDGKTSLPPSFDKNRASFSSVHTAKSDLYSFSMSTREHRAFELLGLPYGQPYEECWKKAKELYKK